MLGLLWVGSVSAQAQDQPVGRVKNLTVPEFDAQNRRKAVLYGGEMVTGPSNVWEITGLKIESYAGGDQLAWIVEAPACSYHDPTKRAWSPGALTARSTDGQLVITGEGFEWSQPNQLLVISNAVRTLLHPRGTNTARVTPSLARQDLELTAKNLNFNAQKMVAVYRGDVRARELLRPGATNPPITLDCGIFAIHLSTNGSGVRAIEAEERVVFTQGPTRATGDRAVYTASNDVITVTGNATWGTDLAEGRGETLILDRKQDMVRSLGHSFVRLRDQKTKPAAGATNEVLELTADNLTAKLPSTNQPQTRIQADGAVVVRRGEQQAGGRQMIYTGTLTNGVAELTGEPWWRTPDAEGTADTLAFDRTANAFRGAGHGRVKLVRRPAKANEKPQAMTVQADEYDVRDDAAILRGNLVAADDQWRIQGAEMRLMNTPGTRRLREVIVRKEVLVRQQMPPESRQVPWQMQCHELRMFMASDGSRIARITTDGAVRLEPARAPAAGESGLPWKLRCERADLSMGASRQWESMVAQENIQLEPLPGSTNGFPWAMNCQQLTLYMAPGSTNQIERVIAERAVRLQQAPSSQGGNHASGLWRLDCDRATVRFAAGRSQVETADAEGNVRAEQLTTNGLAASWTLTSATASLKMGASNRIEQISAQRQVRIVQGQATNGPPVKVGCEAVTMTLNASNAVETVTARDSVVIEQGATRATGTNGVYHSATADFELTGQPSLLYVEDKPSGTNAPRQVRIEGAEVLIWNRTSNQFRGRGPYRITPVGPLNLKTLKP